MFGKILHVFESTKVRIIYIIERKESLFHYFLQLVIIVFFIIFLYDDKEEIATSYFSCFILLLYFLSIISFILTILYKEKKISDFLT